MCLPPTFATMSAPTSANERVEPGCYASEPPATMRQKSSSSADASRT